MPAAPRSAFAGWQRRPSRRTHIYASDAGFPSGIAGSFERLACGRGRRAGAGVERLNLAIAPGTFLGVSGPTGAGKTTFADLLIGLFSQIGISRN